MWPKWPDLPNLPMVPICSGAISWGNLFLSKYNESKRPKKVSYASAQHQANISDCGIFAIALAVSTTLHLGSLVCTPSSHFSPGRRAYGCIFFTEEKVTRYVLPCSMSRQFFTNMWSIMTASSARTKAFADRVKAILSLFFCQSYLNDVHIFQLQQLQTLLKRSEDLFSGEIKHVSRFLPVSPDLSPKASLITLPFQFQGKSTFVPI